MRVFLVDNNCTYSYDSLLEDVSMATCYYPQYKTGNLYDYFLNIVIALAAGKPLTLVDSDLSDYEIDKLQLYNINVPSPVNKLCISSIAELINSVQQSISDISVYTSGTSGQPKKVVHSVPSLTRTIRVSEKYSNQIWAFAYNPTHMAGLQVFFQGFENINTFINVFNLPRQKIYELLTNYAVTNISATPTFYRMLLPAGISVNSVNRVTLGGERSDRHLHNVLLQIFPNAKINNIYASTEAGSLFVSADENFRIQDDISDKIKVEDSELLIHKSLLGESAGFVLSEDYYRTGDLIEWIDEKRKIFQFRGRNNELINIGGYKVNPSEVESVILLMADVIQAKVYGKPNSVLGNVLVAEIKTTKPGQLEERDIRLFLADKIQDFKIPRIIKFVESFSLTRSGKIKRS